MSSKGKLIILAAVLSCLLLLPVLASADNVQFGDKIKFYDNLLGITPQGPFGADIYPYSNTTPKVADFFTFCVETNEYFTPGVEYKVSGVGLAVVRGLAAPPKSLTLQMGTAYLYSQFRQGLKGLSSLDAQTAMQYAIWNQQGLPVPTMSGNILTLYTQYTTDAIGKTDLNYFGVRVMNIIDPTKDPITNPNAYYCQDMLTTVPLPGAVLLLSAGLVRLAAYARRRQED